MKKSILVMIITAALATASGCNSNNGTTTGGTNGSTQQSGGFMGGGTKPSNGDSKPNAGGSNNAGENGPGTTSCADAWANYVKMNPKGHYEEYKTETHAVLEGGQSMPISSGVEKHTVTDSSMASVTTSTTISGHTQPSTITQDEFIKACNQGMNGEISQDFNIEIREKARRSITVAAGSFDCWYVKAHMTPKSSSQIKEILTESWTAGAEDYGFVVKSITTMSIEADGQNMTQITTRELVKRK